MKSFQCFTVDGTGLEELKLNERTSTNSLGSNEVLVQVKAVSLNYRDLMVADGRYGGREETPIIACSDMAGIVTEVGTDVMEFQKGDRVLNAPFRCWPSGKLRPHWARSFVGGAGIDGVLAQQVTYPESALIPIPSHLSYQEGSTLTIAGLTAWSAIVSHGRVKVGDWVLLHGTGGVSIFGAQIAHLMGAKTILTTGSKQKAKFVKKNFAVTETLDYNDENWPEQVKSLTNGNGADIVVDVAGGTSLAKSIKASAPYGRIGLIGVLSGIESTINAIDLIMRQISIRGIFMESAEELRNLARAIRSSKLKPYIDKEFSFEETHEAYRYLQSHQHVGKVVINV